MLTVVRRLRAIFILAGSIFLGMVGFIATLTFKHLIDTPQPLESALPGEARLYRWHVCHVFYTVLGKPENPPLLLLHNPGVGASSYEMRHIMTELAQRYYVYAPDLPGFGLSDRLNMDYTVDTYTNFCHDFLTEVVQTAHTAQRPAILLASGVSCTYAVEVAHNFPDTCAQLILISPVALSGILSLSGAFSSLLRLPLFGLCFYTLYSTRFGLRRLLAQRNPQYRGKQGKHKEQITADVEHFYAATHRFGGEHAPVALWSGKLSRDVNQQFARLQQPVLLIWGEQSLHDRHAEENERHMPERTQLAIMREAGIYVHEQYPDVVITDILDWSDVNSNSTTL